MNSNRKIKFLKGSTKLKKKIMKNCMKYKLILCKNMKIIDEERKELKKQLKKY